MYIDKLIQNLRLYINLDEDLRYLKLTIFVYLYVKSRWHKYLLQFQNIHLHKYHYYILYSYVLTCEITAFQHRLL